MQRPWNLLRVGGIAGAACAFGAEHAYGHAFGERYDLPLPFELYLLGAVAAIAVTFLVIGGFVRDAAWARNYPRANLLDSRFGRGVMHPAVVRGMQLVSALLFLLVVAAGLLGNQDPLRNLAPVTVWIVWWVGMAIVSAFVGDLWAAINPWRTLFAAAEALAGRLKPGMRLSLELRLPAAVGVWPAAALLAAFTWSELVSTRPAVPLYIASMAILYSLLTWAGMVLFGRERWLRQGEVFSVLFGLLARFAPTEARAQPAGAPVLELRPYGVGLLRTEDVSRSTVAFVILYLASVLYDGLLLTPAWAWAEAAIAPGAGPATLIGVRTVGLVGLWLGCLALYLATCRAMAALAGDRADPFVIARGFVLTLVPIGIAYHLAHYLTYLLIQGQHVIPLVSDPFGWGWDLLGTAGYRVDIGIVGARFAWYVALIAIVVGHVVAVVLGHAQAIATFAGPRLALRGECPMVTLMIVFTVASLSILAEPILQKAPAAADSTPGSGFAVPADAVLAEPGSGRLHPVGAGRTAATKLTYGAMASPFHDGTTVTAADLLYPFVAAARWGGGDASSKGQDPAIAAATALMRSRLKGLKVVGADTSRTIRFGDLTYAREQILVDVYLDGPNVDTETMASLAAPWSPLPWHVIALMEEAVARGFAAFSEAEAKRLGVEWLDPVRSEPLKQRLKTLVQEFERSGYVPPPLAGLATEAEARARWKALAAFHATSGHFLVTNGPYVVKSWADGTVVLDVVRDPRYPLGVGSFDAYATPRRARVLKADRSADGLVLTVEIETIDKVMRDYKIVPRTLREAVADFGRSMIPQCRFVVVDATGSVAFAGQGRYRDDGAMLIDLKGKLASGWYTVSVALYPNGNTVDAEIRHVPYDVP